MLAALRRHPALSAAFLLAVAVALWLLVEVVSGLLGWSGRGDEPLAPWMTIGYVGRTHDLDPRLIDATAGFPTPDEAGHPLTLAEIAARQGVPLEDVYEQVERTLHELRPGHGGGPDGNGAGGEGGGSPPATGTAPADPADPAASTEPTP